MLQMVKNPPAVWETQVGSLGWEDPLEKGMATHSREGLMERGTRRGRSPWGDKESGLTGQLALSLSVPGAHRIFDLSYGIRAPAPWAGIKPGPPALGAQHPSPWTTREVPPQTVNILHLFYHSLEGNGSILVTPVFLPGKSHGQRRLVGYSP